MPTNTIQLHRILRASPDKIYRAFLDPDALVKWLPPNGFIGKMHHQEAQVGGSYKMSFTNFHTGQIHSFRGRYVELIPNERICITDNFDDPNLAGEMRKLSQSNQYPAELNFMLFKKTFPLQYLQMHAILGGKTHFYF